MDRSGCEELNELEYWRVNYWNRTEWIVHNRCLILVCIVYPHDYVLSYNLVMLLDFCRELREGLMLYRSK